MWICAGAPTNRWQMLCSLEGNKVPLGCSVGRDTLRGPIRLLSNSYLTRSHWRVSLRKFPHALTHSLNATSPVSSLIISNTYVFPLQYNTLLVCTCNLLLSFFQFLNMIYFWLQFFMLKRNHIFQKIYIHFMPCTILLWEIT